MSLRPSVIKHACSPVGVTFPTALLTFVRHLVDQWLNFAVKVLECLFVTELGRNPVSKHQIQFEYGDEQADAGRDG